MRTRGVVQLLASFSSPQAVHTLHLPPGRFGGVCGGRAVEPGQLGGRASNRSGRLRARWRWLTAWGVLGTARMHHTIATGNVIAKETAGNYALAMFAPRWHPLIDEALAYRRDQPIQEPAHGGAARVRETAAFVLDVIDDARTLAAQSQAMS